MSDTHHVVDATPAPAVDSIPTTIESTPAVEPTPSSTAPATEAIQPAPVTAETSKTPAATTEPAAAPVTEKTISNGEAVVEATPASEGVLGYKAPGFVNSFRFSKKFFWFGEEALNSEALAGFLRTEKHETAHQHAAWSKETGKGLLFLAKRVEDKAAPAGIINLADISDVTKEDFAEFSFKLHGQKHTFQAASQEERASWIIAIATKATEAKELKGSVTGSENYKKHLESLAKPAVAATPLPSTSKESSVPPKKTVEAKAKDAVKKDTSSASSVDEEKKAKKAMKKEEKSKSRSQSRKRGSIFNTLLMKKEDHDEKKEVKEVKKEEKAEEKAEKKLEKEVVKEDKKVEKEQKKEEAKAAHEPAVATEAAAATATTATIAAPPAAIAAEDKKVEDKTESSTAFVPSHQKAKRNSVFGNLFAKMSPSTEKTEHEALAPIIAKDQEVPLVSETAPKLEESYVNKPIDTAEVTAPVDSPAPVTEAPKDTLQEPVTATTPNGTSPNSKGGFMGFIKKQEAKLDGKKDIKKEEKLEKKEQKAVETPVVPAATESSETPVATTAIHSAVTTEPTSQSPIKPQLKDKRRGSLFGNLGAKKEKKEEGISDTEVNDGEYKRIVDGEPKKSTMPQTPGGLFRKLSKVVRPEARKNASHTKPESTAILEDVETKQEIKPEPTAMTNGSSSHTPQSEIRDVPEAITTSTPEVHATA